MGKRRSALAAVACLLLAACARGDEPSAEAVRAGREGLERLGFYEGKGSYTDVLGRRYPVYRLAGKAMLDDEGLKTLPPIPFPFGLNLASSQVTDAGLAALSEQTQLVWLGLGGTGATDACMVDVARMAGLQALDLQGTAVTGAGIALLADKPGLRLYLDEKQVTDGGLRGLAERSGITWEIAVAGTDATLAHLRACNLLHCLYAARGAGQDRPASAEEVVGIHVGNTTVSDAGVRELLALPNLADVYLRYTQVTDAGVRDLARLPRLTKLTLDLTAVSDEGLRALAGLKELREISLERTAVGDAGAALLAEHTRLTTINLHATRVTDAGVAHLARLAHLEWLQLGGTAVGGTGLKALAARDGLMLSLDAAQIAREAFQQLAGVAGIRWRIVAELTDASLHSLRQAGLLHCLAWAKGPGDAPPASADEVVEFRIQGGDVTGACLEDLAALRHLQSLYLIGAGLTDADMPRLRQFERLTALYINSTDITDAGVAEIAALTNLERLRLQGTDATDAGLAQFARLQNLKVLHVRGRSISAAGIQQLQAALPNCRINPPNDEGR